MRIGREGWILGILLIVFVSATAYYSGVGVESERRRQPTTYSSSQDGLAGLYRLLTRQGLAVGRWERSYVGLQGRGVLIVAEPLKRAIGAEEQTALWRWIGSGGVLLVLVDSEPRERGDTGLPTDKVNVVDRTAAPGEVAPEDPASPYFRGVRTLHVNGEIRLEPKRGEHQEVLVSDSQGGYAVTWARSKGRVILVSAGISAANGGRSAVTDPGSPYNDSLTAADNAVFFTNVVQAHTGPGAPVLFDEYHQGFGAEDAGGGIWAAMGAPARAVAWYLLVGFTLIVYNANRRFGAPRLMPVPEHRASTEYIQSMAGLYRRAGASAIAIEAISHAFERDLARKADLSPGAPPERTAEAAGKRLGVDPGPLVALLKTCEAIRAGRDIAEGEALRIARQIEDYRRRCDLVRTR